MLAFIMLAAILVLGTVLIFRLISRPLYRTLSVVVLALVVAFLAIYTNAGRVMAQGLGIPVGTVRGTQGQRKKTAARGKQVNGKNTLSASSDSLVSGTVTAVFPDGSQTVLRI